MPPSNDTYSLQAGDIVQDPLMRRLERCHKVPVGRPLQPGPSPPGHQAPSSGGHHPPLSSGAHSLHSSALRGSSFQPSLCLAPGAQCPPGPRVPLLVTSSGPPYPLLQPGPPWPLVPGPLLPSHGHQGKQNWIRRWCTNRYRQGYLNFYEASTHEVQKLSSFFLDIL